MALITRMTGIYMYTKMTGTTGMTGMTGMNLMTRMSRMTGMVLMTQGWNRCSGVH